MKALSIRQPWAWLIVHGYKDIENRSWVTHYRGPFWVHASKRRPLAEELEEVRRRYRIRLPDRDKLPLGAIVGSAEIVDCIDRSRSRWFEGPYGFVLRKTKARQPVPCTGRLSFFTPEKSVLRRLSRR